jgi:hypothetical protein
MAQLAEHQVLQPEGSGFDPLRTLRFFSFCILFAFFLLPFNVSAPHHPPGPFYSVVSLPQASLTLHLTLCLTLRSFQLVDFCSSEAQRSGAAARAAKLLFGLNTDLTNNLKVPLSSWRRIDSNLIERGTFRFLFLLWQEIE